MRNISKQPDLAKNSICAIQQIYKLELMLKILYFST